MCANDYIVILTCTLELHIISEMIGIKFSCVGDVGSFRLYNLCALYIFTRIKAHKCVLVSSSITQSTLLYTEQLYIPTLPRYFMSYGYAMSCMVMGSFTGVIIPEFSISELYGGLCVQESICIFV